ncbi:MAG: HU family DNA-binding protein [Yoonia sp.]|uniref:HU family DNA-binding protein n=1 Tax=Yoonia sp. TaxID=2212373 RepID=UPI003EF1E4E2
MARKTTAKETPKDTKPAAADIDLPETTVIKKPDLLDQVVARTNLKKRDVKPAVEAALAVIEEALRDGAEMNLPPLGKLRVVKAKPLQNGAQILTLKLRTPKNAAAAVDDADN